MINHREALGFWLNQMGLKGTIVEVGSAEGVFARSVLSQWQGQRMFLVDPWDKQDPEVYKEKQPDNYAAWYESCVALAEHDKRVTLLKMLSVEASTKFANGFLDLVYIDGNHSHRAVMEDMDAWWPKVKTGGIMGGHDFLTKTDEGWFSEVDSAVVRWTKEHNVAFHVTPCTSWWCIKP